MREVESGWKSKESRESKEWAESASVKLQNVAKKASQGGDELGEGAGFTRSTETLKYSSPPQPNIALLYGEGSNGVLAHPAVLMDCKPPRKESP